VGVCHNSIYVPIITGSFRRITHMQRSSSHTSILSVRPGEGKEFTSSPRIDCPPPPPKPTGGLSSCKSLNEQEEGPSAGACVFEQLSKVYLHDSVHHPPPQQASQPSRRTHIPSLRNPHRARAPVIILSVAQSAPELSYGVARSLIPVVKSLYTLSATNVCTYDTRQRKHRNMGRWKGAERGGGGLVSNHVARKRTARALHRRQWDPLRPSLPLNATTPPTRFRFPVTPFGASRESAIVDTTCVAGPSCN
jgi:hypothetical protein